MPNSIFSLLVSSLFLACTSPAGQRGETTIGQSETVQSWPIPVPDTLSSDYQHFSVWGDSLLFALKNDQPYRLVVFDLKARAYLREIRLDPNFLAGRPHTFYAHTPDSIFFVSPNSNVCHLLDANGQLRKKWPFQGRSGEFNVPSMFFYAEPYYEGTSGRLYVTTVPYDWEVWADEPHQRVFDLRTGQGVGEYAPPAPFDGALPTDLGVPYRLVVGDQVIISYPRQDSAQIYHKTTLVPWRKVRLAGVNLPDFPPPLAPADLDDQQKSWDYRVSSPFYEPLFYHSVARCFTRAFHHVQPARASDGKVNDGGWRQTTVFVFDEQFRLVGEHSFGQGRYHPRKAVRLGNGLLFAPHERYWGNEKFLTLNQFLPVAP